MPKNNHARSAGAGGPHEHMIGNQNQHQSHSQQHQRVSSVDGMGPPQHLRKSSMSESMKYTTAPGTSTGGTAGSGSGAGGGGGANNALGMSRNSTGASTVQSQGATSH
ncbi:unnamed protein product, partial [Choristocarpus tenellus]